MLKQAAVAALFAIGLTGCNAHADAPTPIDSRPKPAAPTFLCTPEAGGDPYPCTPEEYSLSEKLNVIYTEAIDTYRQFFDEYVPLLRDGGADEATPVMRETSGGPYLKNRVEQLQSMLEQGMRARGGEIKLVRLDRSPGAGAYGYEVALDACIDSRSVELMRGKKVVGQGYAYAERVFFKRDGDTLKIWDAEGKQVPTC